MNTQQFNDKIILTCIIGILLFIMQSCADDIDSMENRYKEYSRVEDRFDYRTSEFIPLKISAPASSYVMLYERDPQQYPQALPFFSTYIGTDGQFSEKVDVPQHLIGSQIYASVNGQVSTATLKTSGITLAPASRYGETQGYSLSSADVEYDTNTRIKQYFDKLMIKNHDNTKLVDTSVAGVDITTLDDSTEVLFSLVNVTGRYMMQLYYYYYPVERSMPGQDNFQNANKMAEFIKRFLRPEFCISRNWQNKYTGYKNLVDGNLAQNQTGAYIGEDASGWINRNFAYYLNSASTTVKLNYYGWFNSLGEFTKIDTPTTGFPADYKIGFFMYVAVPETDAWNNSGTGDACNEAYYNDINKTKKHFIISTDRIINYEITPVKENGEVVDEPYKHHDRMCATRLLSYNTKGMPCIIYGMEDNLTGKDAGAKDFNDTFFAVQTNPLVDTSDIPVIGEGYYAYEGTLLYEDLYPVAGDYDMNDVIIEYQYKLHYEHIDKTGNKVTGIDFEFVPIWNGATYKSDFYLNIRQDERPDQTFKICSDVNAVAQANASAINRNIAEGKNILDGLTKYVGRIYTDDADNKTYIEIDGRRAPIDMTNIFDKYVRDLDIRNEVFDPFIYVTTTNHEVHMPGHTTVMPESNRYEDELLKKYHLSAQDVYNNKGLEIPFAANIALHSFLTEPGFRQCYEASPITDCYPAFLEWAISKGYVHKNWYMRYNYSGPDR